MAAAAAAAAAAADGTQDVPQAPANAAGGGLSLSMEFVMKRQDCVNCCAFSPDGKRLAVVGEQREISIFCVATKALIIEFDDPDHISDQVHACQEGEGTRLILPLPCGAASRSPDGRMLLIGSQVAARVFDLEGKCLWAHHTGNAVYCCLWFPDGRTVAVPDGSGVSLWDTGSWTQLSSCQGIETPNSVAISPDGALLACCGAGVEGAAVLRLRDSGTVIKVCPDQCLPNSWCTCFSPNGRRLAVMVGINDQVNQIAVLDTANDMRPISVLTGHTSEVVAAVFAADSCLLWSAAWDKTVRCWDTTEGVCLFTLSHHHDSVIALDLSGHRLATGSRDRTAVVWQLPLELRAWGRSRSRILVLVLASRRRRRLHRQPMLPPELYEFVFWEMLVNSTAAGKL